MTLLDTLRVAVVMDTSGLKAGAAQAKVAMSGLKDEAQSASGRFSKLKGIIGSVSPKLKGMADKAREAQGEMASSLEGMGMSAKNAATVSKLAFAAIALAAAKMAVDVAKKVWAAADAMAMLADDAKDTAAYFAGAYGTESKAAQDWAATTAKAYGIYETDLKKSAAGLNSLFRSTGIADEQAAKMSESYATLAYDISAAFSNISLEDAQSALKSLAQGSADGLKTLGITMSETDLKSYAVAKGIATQGKEMTAQQKQVALYRIAMGKLANVQGQYTAKSGDYENVTRKMEASTKNLKESIGTLLLPVMSALKGFITWIVDGLTMIVNAIRYAIAAVTGFFNGLLHGAKQASETAQATEDAAASVDALTEAQDASAEASKAAAVGLASFDKVSSFGSDKSSSEEEASAADDWDAALIGVQDDAGAVTDEFQAMYDSAQNIGASIHDWFSDPTGLGKYWNRVKQWGTDTWNGIKTAGETAWNNAKLSAQTLWSGVKSIGEGVWSGLSGFATAKWNELSGLGAGIWDFWKGVGQATWTAITSFATDLWNGLTALLRGGWSGVKEAAEKAWDDIVKYFTDMWDTLTGAMRGAWEAMSKYVSDLLKPLVDAVKWLLEKSKQVTDAVGNATGGVTKTVSNAVGGFVSGVKGVLGFASGGVFQPNRPQLVYMGDNTTEPEVAAPKSLIRQAVAEALEGAGGRTVTVNVVLDSKVIARAVYDPLQAEGKRRGAGV